MIIRKSFKDIIFFFLIIIFHSFFPLFLALLVVLLAALLAALFLTLFAALGAAAFFSEAAGVLAGGGATGDSGLVFLIAFSINNQ